MIFHDNSCTAHFNTVCDRNTILISIADSALAKEIIDSVRKYAIKRINERDYPKATELMNLCDELTVAVREFNTAEGAEHE